ncbi:MAG: adenylosuccinate lyase [Flavobacteriales bacterium]
MNFSPLDALSPLDGRYRAACEDLAGYFSESALIKYRILVEVEYLIALEQALPDGYLDLSNKEIAAIRDIAKNFTIADAVWVKEKEKITNHDVKAVEYLIKEKLQQLDMERVTEWVHFGLTSQDINNTAIPMMMKDALNKVVIPFYETICVKLEKMANEWENIPMLAHTHGQAASPTRLGKEMRVFSVRMRSQLMQFADIPNSAKFGGATGNMNAHYAAFPRLDWHAFAEHFVHHSLGLKRSFPTTQIEHYDNLAAQCDCLKRLNTILIDLCRDMWTYIMMDYFGQQIKANEVGSSAMPHKVNPIDFENAEGNLGMANAIFEFLSAKLPVSRLQRDLTDSTVLRNLGVPLGHSVLALRSLEKGLGKLLLNEKVIENDLEENWSVLAEAIQTILRREGYPQPYEVLKKLTRNGKALGPSEIREFIDSLEVSNEVKEELRSFSPANYTGK